MCSSESNQVLNFEMASAIRLAFFLLMFFITTEGEEKKSVNKIIIQVPYKIYRHHHTHTKYKVITVPTPKKENTVIYFKEEIQPSKIKHVPSAQVPTKENRVPPKTLETFIPPHQQSATALLQSLASHKNQNLLPTEPKQDYDASIDNQQKPQKSHSSQNIEDSELKFTYKPLLHPAESNHIPNFYPQQTMLSPQYIFAHLSHLPFNPEVHPSYNAFFPKLTYQPILHFPQSNFNQKLTLKPSIETSQNDILPASSQIYRTVFHPRQKSMPYEVKEENQDNKMHLGKYQGAASSTSIVPSIKFSRKGKMHIYPVHNYQIKGVESKIQPNPDYEYEHVGYLIIDGNSRKIVGKDFKDQIHLSN